MTSLHVRLLAAAAVGALTAVPAAAQQQGSPPEQAPPAAQGQAQEQPREQTAAAGAGGQSIHERLSQRIAPPDGVGGPVLGQSRIMNTDGEQIGAATLQAAPNGTLVRASFVNLPAGHHAFHVHETGTCEGNFESAGGHFNPDDASHGYWHEDGPHAGDMPTLFVPQAGEVTVAYFNERLRVNEQLFDDDGAALVVHANADDYRSQPSGNAGDRIACGVIDRLEPQSAEGEAPPDQPARQAPQGQVQ